MPDRKEQDAFALKDCALISIATGRRALTLKELRDNLESVGTDSLYFHFWGGLLEARFEEREYNNDFAAWTRHGLHDVILAERLAMVDPTAYPNLEDLRQSLLDLIDERLDESDLHAWTRAQEPFAFIRSQIIVFDTHRTVNRWEDLREVIPQLSPSSIFYHFIDARRRLPDGLDDFRHWLSGFGEECTALRDRLAAVDPYFGTLTELRRELADLCGESSGPQEAP